MNEVSVDLRRLRVDDDLDGLLSGLVVVELLKGLGYGLVLPIKLYPYPSFGQSRLRYV